MQLAARFLEKTREEWVATFDRLDACIAPVLEMEEAAEFSHNKERNSFAANPEGKFEPVRSFNIDIPKQTLVKVDFTDSGTQIIVARVVLPGSGGAVGPEGRGAHGRDHEGGGIFCGRHSETGRQQSH